MEAFKKVLIVSDFLEQIARNLDIPETKYLDAKKKYEAVGEWLSRKESRLSAFAPEIYPQGSFSLGTVVKPTNRNEYDIDLVCCLTALEKERISQGQLKKMVGDCLKENKIYKGLLEGEGRRCWTLNYANEFHMDILPAIPDRICLENANSLCNTIFITDTKKIQSQDSAWLKSNPRTYIEWFGSRQQKTFMSMKDELAQSSKLNIADIPAHKIKTPLQRAIQILKRHRDIFYLGKNNSHKPISIIITTIAAELYNQDTKTPIYNTIHDILLKIDFDLVRKDGEFYIPNPVNREENFADKWNEDPLFPECFFEWVDDAKKVFSSVLLEETESGESVKHLEKALGTKIEDVEIKKHSLFPTYPKVDSLPKSSPWGS